MPTLVTTSPAEVQHLDRWLQDCVFEDDLGAIVSTTPSEVPSCPDGLDQVEHAYVCGCRVRYGRGHSTTEYAGYEPCGVGLRNCEGWRSPEFERTEFHACVAHHGAAIAGVDEMLADEMDRIAEEHGFLR